LCVGANVKKSQISTIAVPQRVQLLSSTIDAFGSPVSPQSCSTSLFSLHWSFLLVYQNPNSLPHYKTTLTVNIMGSLKKTFLNEQHVIFLNVLTWFIWQLEEHIEEDFA